MTYSDRIELFNAEHMGLAWSFQVNPSSCGNHAHYEEYIRFVAITDNAQGRGTTHAFIRGDGASEKMLGYITLRASSYTKIYEKDTLGFPAMEIFELAVAEEAERQGIGTELVKYALATAYDLNQKYLGIQYITLCADELAVPFYQKMGFARIDEQGEIPRDQWNVDCIPMVLKMPEIIS